MNQISKCGRQLLKSSNLSSGSKRTFTQCINNNSFSTSILLQNSTKSATPTTSTNNNNHSNISFLNSVNSKQQLINNNHTINIGLLSTILDGFIVNIDDGS
ncbi:hypothetical protein DLAC_02315 [Tieghemostelium lacteum]|uniref:Uncharacterized protein n=1 Tax=Tieghemostelium lacteum TaxID=361077 RepID=A0A152A4N9_TIELA|nr:hypothetical protein DLAC_02315 [Tieghemostelium lacteum]|eukprot:KYR01198.1 hypothetical protein DLAC_02315 [Tieghemostelium lacteum]